MKKNLLIALMLLCSAQGLLSKVEVKIFPLADDKILLKSDDIGRLTNFEVEKLETGRLGKGYVVQAQTALEQETGLNVKNVYLEKKETKTSSDPLVTEKDIIDIFFINVDYAAPKVGKWVDLSDIINNPSISSESERLITSYLLPKKDEETKAKAKAEEDAQAKAAAQAQIKAKQDRDKEIAKAKKAFDKTAPGFTGRFFTPTLEQQLNHVKAGLEYLKVVLTPA